MADNSMNDPTTPRRRRSTVLGWRLINRRFTWLWFVALALPGYFGWSGIFIAQAIQNPDIIYYFLLSLPLGGLVLVALWGLALQFWLRPPPLGRHLLQFAVGAWYLGTVVLILILSVMSLSNRYIDLLDMASSVCIGEAVFTLFLPLIYGLVSLTGVWRIWRRHIRRERHAIRRDEGLDPKRGVAPTDQRRQFSRRIDAWGWWRLLPIAATLLLPGWLTFFLLMDESDKGEMIIWLLGIWITTALVFMGWGKLLDVFTRRPPYAGTNLLLACAAAALGMGVIVALMLIFSWYDGYALIIPGVLLVCLTILAGIMIVLMTVWLIARTVILRFRDQRLELADIHEDTQSWKDLDR